VIQLLYRGGHNAIQVTDPVQILARNVDPVTLKRQFGHAITVWGAGGGLKPGITLGKTDDLGFHIVEDKGYILRVFVPSW